MSKADLFSVLSKQLLSIRDGSSAALEIIGLILQEDEVVMEGEIDDSPELPPVFNRKQKKSEE